MRFSMSGGWNLKTPTIFPLPPAGPQSSLSLPKYQVGQKVTSPGGGTRPQWKVLSSRYDSTKGWLYDVEDLDNGALHPDQLERYLSSCNPILPSLPEAKELWGLNSNPVVPNKFTCVIVKNIALNKEFLYCKTHDDEADGPFFCRKATK